MLRDIINLLDVGSYDGNRSSDYEEEKVKPKARRSKTKCEAVINTWAPKFCGKLSRIFPHVNIDSKEPPKNRDVSEMKTFLHKVNNCYKENI